jgi:hypothetical protein
VEQLKFGIVPIGVLNILQKNIPVLFMDLL